jgi:hypothetical protein
MMGLGDKDTEAACQLDAATFVDAAAGAIGVFEADGDGSDLFFEAAQGKPETILHVVSEGLGLGQAFPTNIYMHAW